MNSKTMKRAVRRARHGFTLIELLLVLVILGVLAAVVVPKFTGRTQDARNTAAKTDIAGIETALNAFEVDNGRFPTTDEGLRILRENVSNLSTWKRPYLSKDPKDPWGRDYVYRQPGQNNEEYDLYSLGEDGREGNDDITNWGESK